MPQWLENEPAPDPTAAKQSNTYHVSWKYWRKLWDAIPPWATRESIEPFYAEAERRRARGEDVHVDHIVPLRSPLVCGLHCAANMQVITTKANYDKSNHTWPDMPFEQQDFGFEYTPNQPKLI